ncbi:MAG: hypothetical protein MUC68_06960 [Burkholderiaceae bacterium]|nr:hypothetical protein [Burkholderiaceae bacterium]
MIVCISAAAAAYYAMAAAAVASAYSSYEQGRQEEANRNYQAQLADVQAQEARSAARAAAAETREEGDRTRGAARATYAAGGVSGDAGTPIVIDQDIAARAEEDALAQILQGEARGRGADAEAAFMRAQAKQSRRRANVQTGVSLFRAAASAYTMGADNSIVGHDSTGAGITRSGRQIF